MPILKGLPALKGIPMVDSFYNDLAPYYKYLFRDWDRSVDWHASVLDDVIREIGGVVGGKVLDVACGIGTQSIGLAKLGYRVTASDLSSGAIEQAQREAERHGVQIYFQVADMRQAWDNYQEQFDILIACDNSVPHLLTDDEIQKAFEQFYRCIKPGGLCIISVRDYENMERKAGERKMVPRSVTPIAGGQVVLLDVWEFYDQDHYEITMYLIDDRGGEDVVTRTFRGGRYYCVEIPNLEGIFLEAGFQAVEVLREPYFQPLLVAVKGDN
jgi:2-polyprenyl-3-methyl-5-hydroxy-6-metoxy-1,4-benzoquinol methylase